MAFTLIRKRYVRTRPRSPTAVIAHETYGDTRGFDRGPVDPTSTEGRFTRCAVARIFTTLDVFNPRWPVTSRPCPQTLKGLYDTRPTVEESIREVGKLPERLARTTFVRKSRARVGCFSRRLRITLRPIVPEPQTQFSVPPPENKKAPDVQAPGALVYPTPPVPAINALGGAGSADAWQPGRPWPSRCSSRP
jgi:hypothetical protein